MALSGATAAVKLATNGLSGPNLNWKHKAWKPSESSYSNTVINKKSQKNC